MALPNPGHSTLRSQAPMGRSCQQTAADAFLRRITQAEVGHRGEATENLGETKPGSDKTDHALCNNTDFAALRLTSANRQGLLDRVRETHPPTCLPGGLRVLGAELSLRTGDIPLKER
jgi:hypothetical protein